MTVIFKQNGIIIDEKGPRRYQAKALIPDTKRYRKRTLGTFEEALDWATGERQRLLSGGLQVEPGKSTVQLAEVAKHALQMKRRRQCTERYIDKWFHRVRIMIGAGIRDLDDPRICEKAQKWLDEMTCRGRPASRKTRLEYMLILRQLGRLATDRRFGLRHNPFSELMVVGPNSQLPTTYKLYDLRRGVQYQYSHLPGWLMFCLIAYTGLRSSAAAKVRWSWVDMKSRTLHVPADVQKGRSGKRRDLLLEMQPELVATLQHVDWPEDLNQTMSGLSPEALETSRTRFMVRVVGGYMERIGIKMPESRPIHSLRHTFASLLAATGASPWDIQDELGHTTPQMSKHYASLRKKFKQQVASEGWPTGTLCIRDLPGTGVHSRDEDDDLVVIHNM